MHPDKKKIVIPCAADGIYALVGYAQGKRKKGKDGTVKKGRSFFLFYAFGEKRQSSHQKRSDEYGFFVSEEKLLHVWLNI